MSLAIVFKGPEGVVLAADSRVTLTWQIPNPGSSTLVLPATYDNATKLLRVNGQNYVGVVTYGLGAIGQTHPRTAHSFVPEFEAELGAVVGRLPVGEFAARLSDFFVRQWTALMPVQPYTGDPMIFMVGGFDPDDPYGKVFEFQIPTAPTPVEQHAGMFGIRWGGQREFTDRLVHGMDPALLGQVESFLGLQPTQTAALSQHLTSQLSARVPYEFLPLQDCVDFSIFLIRTTVAMQSWLVGSLRGVGGAIDVATITRTDGFLPIQQKKISGER